MPSLTLSRKLHERIMIGPDVTVTVTRLGEFGCRLTIDAPAGVAIYREEIAPREFLRDRTADDTRRPDPEGNR